MIGALKYFEETGSCFFPLLGLFFQSSQCNYLAYMQIQQVPCENLKNTTVCFKNLQEQHHTTKMGNFIIKHYFLLSSFLVGLIHSWGKVSFRNLVLFYNVMPLTLLIRISLKENVNNQEFPKALPTLEKVYRTKKWKLQTSPFYFLYTEDCCRERTQ